MKQVSLMAVALCLLSRTYAAQPQEARKPVKVFLLVGQRGYRTEPLRRRKIRRSKCTRSLAWLRTPLVNLRNST